MKKIIPNPFASKEGQKEFNNSPETGLIGQITFDNPAFWENMQKAFGIGKNEEMTGLVISENTIKARFNIK